MTADETPMSGGTRREEPDAGSGGTLREDPAADLGGTRREEPDSGADPNGGTRREDQEDSEDSDSAAATDFSFVNLPPELASRFNFVKELRAGAEGIVLVVREVATESLRVLKLYNPAVTPDDDALAALANALPEHVVPVLERGSVMGRSFEIQEYCENGSLRELLQRQVVVDVREVITEVASALEHIQEFALVHRDIKPENILVRSVDPLDLAIADFGLVRVVENGVRYTRAWGTPEYQPPEAADAVQAEVSPAWDWWSLGMIVAEIAGERSPFALPNGTFAPPSQIRNWIAQRPIDLSGVKDPRLTLLCRGLLTRDSETRWRADQVVAWLEGESPPVVDSVLVPVRPTRTVSFCGEEFADPIELAKAFQSNWNKALQDLFQVPDWVLIGELSAMLDEVEYEEALKLLQSQPTPQQVPVSFARLLIELDPWLQPIYNEVRVTPAGLEKAAIAAIPKPDGPIATTLDDIFATRVQQAWRTLDGCESGPRLRELWGEYYAAYSRGVLELMASGWKPLPEASSLARAWLLLVVVTDGASLKPLRDAVAMPISGSAEGAPWWRKLAGRQTDPPSLMLALLTRAEAEKETRQMAERLAAEEAARERAQPAPPGNAEAKQRDDRWFWVPGRGRERLLWLIIAAAAAFLPGPLRLYAHEMVHGWVHTLLAVTLFLPYYFCVLFLWWYALANAVFLFDGRLRSSARE